MQSSSQFSAHTTCLENSWVNITTGLKAAITQKLCGDCCSGGIVNLHRSINNCTVMLGGRQMDHFPWASFRSCHYHLQGKETFHVVEKKRQRQYGHSILSITCCSNLRMYHMGFFPVHILKSTSK